MPFSPESMRGDLDFTSGKAGHEVLLLVQTGDGNVRGDLSYLRRHHGQPEERMGGEDDEKGKEGREEGRRGGGGNDYSGRGGHRGGSAGQRRRTGAEGTESTKRLPVAILLEEDAHALLGQTHERAAGRAGRAAGRRSSRRTWRGRQRRHNSDGGHIPPITRAAMGHDSEGCGTGRITGRLCQDTIVSDWVDRDWISERSRVELRAGVPSVKTVTNVEESKIMQAHDVVFDAITRIHGWQGRRGQRPGVGATTCDAGLFRVEDQLIRAEEYLHQMHMHDPGDIGAVAAQQWWRDRRTFHGETVNDINYRACFATFFNMTYHVAKDIAATVCGLSSECVRGDRLMEGETVREGGGEGVGGAGGAAGGTRQRRSLLFGGENRSDVGENGHANTARIRTSGHHTGSSADHVSSLSDYLCHMFTALRDDMAPGDQYFLTPHDGSSNDNGTNGSHNTTATGRSSFSPFDDTGSSGGAVGSTTGESSAVWRQGEQAAYDRTVDPRVCYFQARRGGGILAAGGVTSEALGNGGVARGEGNGTDGAVLLPSSALVASASGKVELIASTGESMSNYIASLRRNGRATKRAHVFVRVREVPSSRSQPLANGLACPDVKIDWTGSWPGWWTTTRRPRADGDRAKEIGADRNSSRVGLPSRRSDGFRNRSSAYGVYGGLYRPSIYDRICVWGLWTGIPKFRGEFVARR